MARLIDVDHAIQQAQKPSIYDLCDTVDFLKEQPIVDGVHAAGGCYCRECFHSVLEKYEDGAGWVTPMDEYWCNEHKISMPLNGFCSEGRKDKMKDE